MFADEERGRQSHAEIAAIESQLHQSAIGDAHAENLGKSLHHGVSDIVGEAPKGETAGHQHEGQKVFLYYFEQQMDFELPNLDLTEEDKIYLCLKWGKSYKPEEWVALE